MTWPPLSYKCPFDKPGRAGASLADRWGERRAMTEPETVIVGVDVGSTTTSGGLVTADGTVLWTLETRTHRNGPGSAFDVLQGLVGDLLAQARTRGSPAQGVSSGPPRNVDIEGGRLH